MLGRRSGGKGSLGSRGCRLEPLEARRVLTTIAIDWWEGAEKLPDEWAEQIATNHGFHDPWTQDAGPAPHIEQFGSEADAENALGEWASTFWQDLLGAEVTKELLTQRYPFRFGLDEVGFPQQADNGVRLTDLSNTLGPIALAAEGRTNTQVSGVDESDIVEFTVDDYLFVSRRGELRVFDISDPAQTEEVGRLQLPSANSEFFVVGDRLVAVSSGIWQSTGLTSKVQIYDIETKSDPQLVSSFEFDGNIQASRLSDGRLTLVAHQYMSLPQPKLVSSLDSDVPIGLGKESIGRFETQEEYLTRVRPLLIAEFLPDVIQVDADGVALLDADLGTWSDLSWYEDGFRRDQVSIVNVDVLAESPQLLGGEVVLGATAQTVYADADTIYLVENPTSVVFLWPGPWQDELTDIIRLSHSADGDIVANAGGRIEGTVRDARMLNEYEGRLRVAASKNLRDGEGGQSADFYVMEQDGNQLVVIGSLQDIADGERLVAAHFAGDKAVVTTAEFVDFIPIGDPLHGIDLSDPTNPVEVSDVEIPGVTTHLQWISDTHLVGIGYIEDDAGGWRDHVSLYDVTDLANPSVVHTWQGDENVWPNFNGFGQEALAVHFDADSGTLVLPFAEFGSRGRWMFPIDLPVERPWSDGFGAQVFSIDPQAEEPLLQLGTVGRGHHIRRAAVIGDYVIAVGFDAIFISNASNPDELVKRIPLRSPLTADHFAVMEGTSKSLDVLRNDHLPEEGAIITEISESQIGAEVGIAEDGKSIVYTAPTSGERFDELTYTVTMSNGESHRGRFTIAILESIHVDPIDLFSDSTAQVSIQTVDQDGRPVEIAEVGDALWIELYVDGDDTPDQGVFQALLEVEFDRELLELVEAPKPVGPFTNGFRATENDTGFAELGGFSSTVDPTGPGPQLIARFEVIVRQTGDAMVSARAVDEVGKEVLLYGQDNPLRNENVSASRVHLTVNEPQPTDTTPELDTNEDGHVTAVDVLLVVNYLNSQPGGQRAGHADSEGTTTTQGLVQAAPQRHAFDVTNDGFVTPIDVLAIVNHINSRVPLRAEAEFATVVDSELSVGDDTLQMLAAEQAFAWNETRRR